MTGYKQAEMVDRLRAADYEKRNVMHYCTRCRKQFEATEGDLERLCPECRRGRV